MCWNAIISCVQHGEREDERIEEKTKGLNWITGNVCKIVFDSKSIKVPHIGWNVIEQVGDSHYIFSGHPAEGNMCTFYFVHSYEYKIVGPSCVLAITKCSGKIIAAVGNIIGVQLHPEKSGNLGVIFCYET